MVYTKIHCPVWELKALLMKNGWEGKSIKNLKEVRRPANVYCTVIRSQTKSKKRKTLDEFLLTKPKVFGKKHQEKQ